MGARWRLALGALVGLAFLVAGIAKAVDFEGFMLKATYYRAVPYVWMVRTGWATVGVEIVLGAALLVGCWRRPSIVVAAAMLLGFSVLIAYAWHAYGIVDCACFGSLADTPPWLGLVKNVVMLGMLALAWPARALPRSG